MKTSPLIRSLFMTLRQERPMVYEEVCRNLEGLTIRLTIGQDRLLFFFSEGGHCEPDLPGKIQVRLSTTDTTLKTLVSGHMSLLCALERELLTMHGDVQALVRCHDSISQWLIGLMGCKDVNNQVDRWLATNVGKFEERGNGR